MDFALLQVGINEYPFVPLKGCVNDCINLSRQFSRFGLTVSRFGLYDSNATRANILESLRWLVRQDVPTLIFQYSGHGTRVRDRSGDETGPYDSAIVPVDFIHSGVIVDDELAEIYSLVAPDKRLIILSDSCHSGKSQRAFVVRLKSELQRFGMIGQVPRFMPPNLIPGQMLDEFRGNNFIDNERQYFTRRKSILLNNERCVLISSCKEDQTSADAWIEKSWQGAGTAALLWAWTRAGQWAAYSTVAQYANGWLKENGYDQVLRVEGKAGNLGKSLFT